MAKGASSKVFVEQKLLEIFEGSFAIGEGAKREIRIPLIENGEALQIKVGLTCAKTMIEAGSDEAIPAPAIEGSVQSTAFPTVEKKEVKASAEEQEAVANLMASLGL